MFRGGRTEVTAPKPVRFPVSDARLVGVGLVRLATFRVELMPSNCVWLKVLKVSRRTSNRALSLIRISFESEMSQLLIGGAIQEVAAGFQAEAAESGRREGGDVELAVGIAAVRRCPDSSGPRCVRLPFCWVPVTP